MDDSTVNRCIGLAALVVGLSVLFFAIKLPLSPNSNIPLIRKAVGSLIAAALILYGIFSLITG